MPFDHEPSRPPLEAVIHIVIRAGGRVKLLLGEHGVLLDLKPEGQDSREGIGELQDAEGTHETGDVGKLGDGGADDKGDCPVDGDQGYPQPFTGCGSEGRGVEELLEDFDVGNFDADVSI